MPAERTHPGGRERSDRANLGKPRDFVRVIVEIGGVVRQHPVEVGDVDMRYQLAR